MRTWIIEKANMTREEIQAVDYKLLSNIPVVVFYDEQSRVKKAFSLYNIVSYQELFDE